MPAQTVDPAPAAPAAAVAGETHAHRAFSFGGFVVEADLLPGKDVAAGLGEELDVPVIYHEVIDHLADRMRVRKSHVVKLLDGKAGLLERLTADQTSLFIHSADEIIGKALEGQGAVIRGWGATHLLRDIPHVVTVRVCAPLETRRKRMCERLNTSDVAQVAEEIHRNDEAHTAIVKRHYGLQWSDPEHYDLVLNTSSLGEELSADLIIYAARAKAELRFSSSEGDPTGRAPGRFNTLP